MIESLAPLSLLFYMNRVIAFLFMARDGYLCMSAGFTLWMRYSKSGHLDRYHEYM